MRVSLLLVIIILMILGLFSGSALAVRTLAAANETSGLTVDTFATCDGNFGAHSTLASQLDNEDMQNNPPLVAGEVFQTTAYSENTMAIKGNTTYAKHFAYNDANQVPGGNNLDSTRLLTFEADSNGRMSSQEEVTFFEAATAAENSTTCCPFPGQDNTTLPAENTMVQSGSNMDVTKVSALSHATTTTVSDTDNDVSVHYDINAQGLNGTGSDAEGTASAYIKVHEMAGRGNATALGADTQFEDTTSVSGLFQLQKSMTYETDE
jgi:hypothetical protein